MFVTSDMGSESREVERRGGMVVVVESDKEADVGMTHGENFSKSILR